ncbi:hypothetical protein ACXIVK_37835, partial [Paraburkholderia caledonica]
ASLGAAQNRFSAIATSQQAEATDLSSAQSQITDANFAHYGNISAPNGTAEIAVGNKMLLQDSSSSHQVFVQTAGGGAIVNAGAVEAA